MGDNIRRISSWTKPLSINVHASLVNHCSWLYSWPSNPGIHKSEASNWTSDKPRSVSIADAAPEDCSQTVKIITLFHEPISWWTKSSVVPKMRNFAVVQTHESHEFRLTLIACAQSSTAWIRQSRIKANFYCLFACYQWADFSLYCTLLCLSWLMPNAQNYWW